MSQYTGETCQIQICASCMHAEVCASDRRQRDTRGALQLRHGRSRTSSSPAEAAPAGPARCQREAAGWCLYSPRGRINPELHSRLHLGERRARCRPPRTAVLLLKRRRGRQELKKHRRRVPQMALRGDDCWARSADAVRRLCSSFMS